MPKATEDVFANNLDPEARLAVSNGQSHRDLFVICLVLYDVLSVTLFHQYIFREFQFDIVDVELN